MPLTINSNNHCLTSKKENRPWQYNLDIKRYLFIIGKVKVQVEVSLICFDCSLLHFAFFKLIRTYEGNITCQKTWSQRLAKCAFFTPKPPFKPLFCLKYAKFFCQLQFGIVYILN